MTRIKNPKTHPRYRFVHAADPGRGADGGPFLWMVSTSFKLPGDQFTKTLIPAGDPQ